MASFFRNINNRLHQTRVREVRIVPTAIGINRSPAIVNINLPTRAHRVPNIMTNPFRRRMNRNDGVVTTTNAILRRVRNILFSTPLNNILVLMIIIRVVVSYRKHTPVFIRSDVRLLIRNNHVRHHQHLHNELNYHQLHNNHRHNLNNNNLSNCNDHRRYHNNNHYHNNHQEKNCLQNKEVRPICNVPANYRPRKRSAYRHARATGVTRVTRPFREGVPFQ